MKQSIISLFTILLCLSACGEEEVQPLEEAEVQENVQIIELSSVGNEMRFDKEEIRVTAGQPVRIVLVNEADMDMMIHNVVIVTEGSVQEVGMAAIQEADNDYVPDMPEVLFASSLADPGETIEFEFDPPEPGTYEFVCTFPGHFTTMRGLFIVEEE
ncbi:MAG: plastocyanin/azurin family copper-binding protein [Balneolales bacterium]